MSIPQLVALPPQPLCLSAHFTPQLRRGDPNLRVAQGSGSTWASKDRCCSLPRVLFALQEVLDAKITTNHLPSREGNSGNGGGGGGGSEKGVAEGHKFENNEMELGDGDGKGGRGGSVWGRRPCL
eukprot:77021-Hanusia_phi.AAC.2